LKEKYAKDKIKLYYKDKSVNIPIESTLEAVPIIQKYIDQIEEFEVIQGNMDDVFVNVVRTEQDK